MAVAFDVLRDTKASSALKNVMTSNMEIDARASVGTVKMMFNVTTLLAHVLVAKLGFIHYSVKQNAKMDSMVKIVGQHAGIAKVAKYATKKMVVVLLVRSDSQDHSAKLVWTKLSIF